jgi:hypothetical protein
MSSSFRNAPGSRSLLKWMTRRQNRLTGWTLLILILAALFGMLGAVAALAVGVRAHHSWRRWTLFSLLVAACVALLVNASLAPIIQPRQTTNSVESSDRLETMAGLFNIVNQIPGNGPPLRIVTVGSQSDNTILVMLRGQTTDNIGAAVKSVMGISGEFSADAVRRGIEAYRHTARLPDGTTVILAGHSFGGVVAQEIAREPHASDFKVAAVVTWGSPTIGGHAASVKYQQYFSQYDFVPMLSAHLLAPLLLQVGPVGTLLALLAMQQSPRLKATVTGQTYVPDMGQYCNPQDWVHIDGSCNDAHNGYGKSQWLAHQTLTYMRDGKRTALPLIYW